MHPTEDIQLYRCEICKEGFHYHSDFTRHLTRKTSCNKDVSMREVEKPKEKPSTAMVVFIPDSQPITQTARKRIPVDLDSLYELD
jgi:hypothetical protein